MTEDKKKESGDSSSWGPMGGGPPKSPKFVLQQVNNLRQIQEMLEGVVNQKQSEVERLQEQLIRLKHGGGQ